MNQGVYTVESYVKVRRDGTRVRRYYVADIRGVRISVYMSSEDDAKALLSVLQGKQ